MIQLQLMKWIHFEGEHQEAVTFVLKREVGDMVLELKRNVYVYYEIVENLQYEWLLHQTF